MTGRTTKSEKLSRGVVVAFLGWSLLFPVLGAQEPGDREDRMAWWREARFGMFIHWGLYSLLGGEWQGIDYGKEMGGASAEWIMLQANIPKQEYAALAGRFNPVKFSARDWVELAREAGMRYLIITAKHHDGFSLFDSAFTEYDIVDATPFGRDVIRELADECARQGLRFGVYYSHSKDWYHRRQVRRDDKPPSDEYVRLVRGQLQELLTQYGDMAVLWFDTGDEFTEINTSYGELVKKLQPRTLISGRLRAREGLSDYVQQRDRTIPATRVHSDAETPMTLRDNWGFDRNDDNWKSDRDLLERLCLTVCRGANLLLNVGPRPDGTLCPEEIARLKTIGRWMSVNGEAIYGTTASPFDFDFDWGSISLKPGRLFLHVMKWNPRGVVLYGIQSTITRAYLLADPGRNPLSFEHDPDRGSVTIAIPETAPDPHVSIIVVEYAGELRIDPKAEGEYHWVKGDGIRLRNR